MMVPETDEDRDVARRAFTRWFHAHWRRTSKANRRPTVQSIHDTAETDDRDPTGSGPPDARLLRGPQVAYHPKCVMKRILDQEPAFLPQDDA
jgi:hypothetical protein